MKADNSRTHIVTFSRHPWSQQAWKNRHHVISRLTRWYRILYVEEPIYIRHLLRSLSRQGVSESGRKSRTENVIPYCPPAYLPRIYGYPKIERLSQRLRNFHLRWVCQRMGIHYPILIIWDPEFSYMLDHFNESLRCYFVDDQYSLFTGTNAIETAREEEALLKRVNLVFCTSETLCNDKKRLNRNVHLIANGVDYGLFAPAASNLYPAPPELQEIKRPILGFVGNVDDRVNYGLLTAVANDNPSWSIVLIGPYNICSQQYREEFNQLLACKNARWLGFRTLQNIPLYIQGMDVCAIVNRVNDFAQFVYPIKLHEYLAAGKPIISTAIPSIIPFRDVVHIADSPAEWKKYLEQALTETETAWIERRQAIARQHTWDHRAEQVHRILEVALKK